MKMKRRPSISSRKILPEFLFLSIGVLCFVLHEARCSGIISMDEGSVELSSPGNYSGYDRDLNDKTLLLAEEGDVILFKLYDVMVDCGDEVSGYDGDDESSNALFASLCTTGSKFSKPLTTTSSNKLFIVFKTDNTSKASEEGYRISAIEGRDESYCNISSPGENFIATSSERILTSPQFPNQYSNNMKCEWSITTEDPDATILLKFLFIDIDSGSDKCFDSVTVFDGEKEVKQICGNEIFAPGEDKAVLSSGNTLRVRFTTDDIQTEHGFKMSYKQIVPSTTTTVTRGLTTATSATTTTAFTTTTTTSIATSSTVPVTTQKRTESCYEKCKRNLRTCLGPHRSCTQYEECYPSAYSCNCITRPCPFGTFWSTELGMCDSATKVFCRNDTCVTNPSLIAYASEFNCRSYYKCSEGAIRRSVPMCCDAFHSFSKAEQRCVPDVSCRWIPCTVLSSEYDQDGSMSTFPTTTQKELYRSRCNLRADVIDPSTYHYIDTYLPQPSMRCPPGRAFNNTLCTCANDVISGYKATERVCEETVKVTFNGSDVKNEKVGVPVYPSDIQTTTVKGASYGRFNGKSSVIEIPYFDQKLILNFTAIIRYYTDDKKGSDFQALLGTCGRGVVDWASVLQDALYGNTNMPSLAVILNKKRNTVIVIASTRGRTLVLLKLPYMPNEWNQLELTYDGRILHAKNKPLVSTRDLGPKIREDKKIISEPLLDFNGPIRIGHCAQAGFDGYMDMVKIYECVS